jgi:bifunctional non-homologous end joining protein LigD
MVKGKPPKKPAPGSLGTYADKRDFTITPEPPPGEPVPAGDGPPIYMIHKHDARRLHYDLRLEIEGALASWAVPQGPSFNPGDKRLAVPTEDHPMAYANFEGRIPDGEYGAGDALVWDRGIYETVPPGRATAMREKGHLDLLFLGEKLKGRWHLVRTRGQAGKPQWLLMKAQDEYATEDYDVVNERPESVISGRQITRGPTPAAKRRAGADPIKLLVALWPPPPLAVLAGPPPGADHFEAHAGGQRAFAAVGGGRVALQSEAGTDLAKLFPTVVKALAALGMTDAVFEGELSAVPKPRLVLHDLLHLEGDDLRERPFTERHGLLAALPFANGAPIAVAPPLGASFAEAELAARKGKWKGVLSREKNAPWGPGPAVFHLPVRQK